MTLNKYFLSAETVRHITQPKNKREYENLSQEVLTIEKKKLYKTLVYSEVCICYYKKFTYEDNNIKTEL